MKFKVDENLPVETAVLIRNEGYDAVTVWDQNLGGANDKNIAKVCNKEGRTLITLDKDFANIRSYPPGEYSGLIVFRLIRQDKVHVLKTIKRILPILRKQKPEKQLWIVEESNIRIRS
jgi:predicted nuclease of predicted toxin-antitoxin system